MPDQYCETCGERINKGRMSISNYLERRFCSLRCKGEAQRRQGEEARKAQSKTCIACGREFHRRPHIANADWEGQMTCSLPCARLMRWGRPRGQYKQGGEAVAPTPRMQERDGICACGNPATTRIYFEQGNAGGWYSTGHLDVCADCRDLALETDPTVRLEPVRSRYPERLWPDDEAEYPYTPHTGGFANRRAYHD